MIIADSSYSMKAAYSSYKKTESSETLRAWVDPPPEPQNVQAPAADTLSQSSLVDAINNAQDDPEIEMLRNLIEVLTGHKIDKLHPLQIQPAQAPVQQAAKQDSPQQKDPQKVGWGVSYQRTDTYTESQRSMFQADGVIKTADGKEINFSVNVAMEYQYSETSQTSLRLGDAKKMDPLVVNFGGSAAQLSSQRFSFDLSSNGQNKNINMPTGGSGFLVLDKNGNGKIDDGGEMFGPATGNGFAELSAYDKTGKGWIDSGNPVFDKLKVWTKNDDGTDKLTGLSALGIGAISTKAIGTPFDIKAEGNATLGSIRSTGVFLRENGVAGTVQQVDLTV